MKNIKSFIIGVLATLAIISTLSFVLPDDILGKSKNKKQLLAENEELVIQLSKNSELLEQCQFKQGLQNKLLFNRMSKTVVDRNKKNELEFLAQLKKTNEHVRGFRNWIDHVKNEVQRNTDSLSYGSPDLMYVSKADVQHKLFDSLYYEGPRAYHLETQADSIALLLNNVSRQLGYLTYKYTHRPILSVAPRNQNYSTNELQNKELGLVMNKLIGLQNQLFLQEARILVGFDQYLLDNPIKKENPAPRFSSTNSTEGKPFYFESGAMNALYLNCGNPLSLKLIGVDAGTLSYNVTGGSKKIGKKQGDVIIYPKGRTVNITVSNNGTPLGRQHFKVKTIPQPTIKVRPNGKKMTATQERTGLSAAPRSISVVVIPDIGFKATLPSEARYYVTKWTATLVRGKRPVGGSLTMSKTKGDLTTIQEKAKPGDRILVEVKTVIRKNSLGQSERVNVGLTVKNILL